MSVTLLVPGPRRGARNRLAELDGLRGIAALVVVLSHLLIGVFRARCPDYLLPSEHLSLFPIYYGSLYVGIFFVLSGDVLSKRYWENRSMHAIASMALKRYCRLMIPVLGCALIVLALCESDLVFNRPAAAVLGVEGWLGRFLPARPELTEAVAYATLHVFVDHPAIDTFNAFLWTMRIEFFGSIFVAVLLALDFSLPEILNPLRKPLLLFATGACLVTDGSYMACFPFGMLCGLFRAEGGFEKIGRFRRFAVPSLITALVLGSYCNHVWLADLEPRPVVVAACVVVPCVCASPRCRRLLSRPFCLWFAKISFPLYLMHFPVIVSFTSGAVMIAHAHGGLGPVPICAIIVASAVLSVVSAVLFAPVDALAIWMGNRFCRLVLRERAGGHYDPGLKPVTARAEKMATPSWPEGRTAWTLMTPDAAITGPLKGR